MMALSFAVLSLVSLVVPCLLCFCRILKATFDLNIWWSVQQLDPNLSFISWHLVMMKPIICQCLERGWIQVVLRSSFCLNMVFATISSNSDHTASRSWPLELHFRIPYFPMTKGRLSFSFPILALKSPISSNLSVRVMPLSTLSSWL